MLESTTTAAMTTTSEHNDKLLESSYVTSVIIVDNSEINLVLEEGGEEKVKGDDEEDGQEEVPTEVDEVDEIGGDELVSTVPDSAQEASMIVDDVNQQEIENEIVVVGNDADYEEGEENGNSSRNEKSTDSLIRNAFYLAKKVILLGLYSYLTFMFLPYITF